MDELQMDTNSLSESASEYATSERAQETPREEKLATGANTGTGICYCGKERNLNIVELLCANCSRWFHESCIGYQLGKLVPFITNYVFVCKNCSQSGLEVFRKSQATIPQMCITAIANMQQNALKEGKTKFLFSKDKEIIPYIEQYWEAMTTMPRRVTQSWYSTVQRSLVKDVSTLFTYEENSEFGTMFGLVTQDLAQIKPNYDSMASSLTKNNRQYKRKPPGNDSGPTGKKGRPSSDITANVKLPAHGYPLEHPFNKDGYRYILAEPDPHAPFRQEFDESSDWAGKPIPGWLYRTLVPNCVLLALHDRAPQLKISEDRLSVTGDKGYCMVRATHSVNRGRWYFEAIVDDMPEGSATRLGWGQEYGNLQAPLGYDKFGYSWRSRKGTRFHESHGKHYSDAYAEGEVLGFLIDLPDEVDSNYLPNTFKDRPLVKFKSHLYYEDKDKVQETLKGLQVQPGSKIEFFKNGKSQSVAFSDIYGGLYYPTISIHKNATVSVNFGPNFKHPEILKDYKAKGMCERVEELISEQCLSDLLYLTENDGRLRLDNFNFSKLK
ncbi:PREDICTED: set1/Ash2 histone methyltransferase complex subunit ASH2 isoform X3 [Rhagoletis zephyria]|uniref:set1/Ash2 histone methyltransferase complex subunit ASH2 isoform X3 n=1 Tax=Rhagoletis zephyria TaxID=28612 RepID=UPI0008118E0C|nr:PREDICTED: set1/Ash2 histone methyltransferase complex subunit ASH2 isoform X3 [Rhagoletis zephyria]